MKGVITVGFLYRAGAETPLLFPKSKGGLSKGGLGPKGANWAKKGPFGAISALPPWLWGAEELVPIGPEKAPIGPEKVPICPEKARFRRKDFPPIFSENLGLKPPFASPRLDFPNPSLPVLFVSNARQHFATLYDTILDYFV